MNSFKKSLAVLALCLVPFMAWAAPADGALTDAQKKAVEDVVRELLTKKEPDIIVTAAQVVQERMEKEELEKGQAAVKNKHKELNEDETSPIAGSKDGDVTVIEFFDYQCGYCKAAQKSVQDLLASDKNVRVIFKEYPILGKGSIIAAQAALAAAKQGKYLPFHEELMNSKEQLTKPLILKTAQKLKLDSEKLIKDMNSEETKKIIAANHKLGMEIGARGTPTFIIGGQVYPGVLPIEKMKEMIEKARQDSKKK